MSSRVQAVVRNTPIAEVVEQMFSKDARYELLRLFFDTDHLATVEDALPAD